MYIILLLVLIFRLVKVEGAWNEDGKGESIWDRYCHTPGNISNGDTGDVSCDSYHNYRQDVQQIKNMGLTAYRLSIAWTRIMPQGIIKQDIHCAEIYLSSFNYW